jgi:D-glycero-D-manno-heptose 1,7-bisphosphate phosphatase
MSRRGAFLDRDGTIIPDSGFLKDPADVRLLDGAADAIRRLSASDFVVVVVTNQSGIARGLISIEEYRRVEARLDELLTSRGAPVDATYFCPHYPEVSGPCHCRKPGLTHYRDAAQRFDLDFSRSIWIGDRLSDLEAAQVVGGRGILVLTGDGESHREEAGLAGFDAAPHLGAAVDLALERPPVRR